MRSDLNGIAKQLEMYRINYAAYPADDTQLSTLKAKFSFGPVASNVIACINPTGTTAGFAIFARTSPTSQQYTYMSDGSTTKSNVYWSSAALCGSTPYTTYVRWGGGWVHGG